jgi:prenylcysteine oxidase/farnesylcysteine lyase
VAIIGAGAAGSSAAFWIERGRERLGANIVIDIYESESYVGGRKYLFYFIQLWYTSCELTSR